MPFCDRVLEQEAAVGGLVWPIATTTASALLAPPPPPQIPGMDLERSNDSDQPLAPSTPPSDALSFPPPALRAGNVRRVLTGLPAAAVAALADRALGPSRAVADQCHSPIRTGNPQRLYRCWANEARAQPGGVPGGGYVAVTDYHAAVSAFRGGDLTWSGSAPSGVQARCETAPR